jgi:hypothetical protein
MSTASALLDPYSLRARLQPALLALFPILIAFFALAPAAWEPARAAAVVFGAIGGTLLLSHMARDAGKGLEPALFAAWGGKPSVAMLRHRDTRIASGSKQRYHQRLSALLGTSLPTVEQEANDPAAADGAYEAANAWLLARTRDHETFGLLFAENISYGFRRNFFALRRAGLVITLLSLAAILSAQLAPQWPWSVNSSLLLAAAIAIAVYGTLVLLMVRRSWVKRAAEEYGRRLLECVDHL